MIIYPRDKQTSNKPSQPKHQTKSKPLDTTATAIKTQPQESTMKITTIENIRDSIAARVMQDGASYDAAHEISSKALAGTKPETEYDQNIAELIECAFLDGLEIFSPLVNGLDTVISTKIGANYFASSHLPEPLKNISKRFYWLAHFITRTLPDCEQKVITLRHLLIAKDAAVRAMLKPNGQSLSSPFEF